MELKSENDVTEQELMLEHRNKMKAIRKHHAIERDKHKRTPEQRSKLLELMRSLYNL